MKHHANGPRGFWTAAGIVAGTVALLLLGGTPGYTDDTDLLRKNTAKPYIMLILDTSASMNLRTASTDWLPLGGDDPRSRIYQAKQALYEVFQGQSRVNYGFMTFNQDELRVQAKHWLYRPTSDASWALDYPKAPSGTGADATDDSFTIGRAVASNPGDPGLSCANPLDLNNVTQRARASRWPKLGADGSTPTSLWVKKLTKTYKLTVSLASGTIGVVVEGGPDVQLALQAETYGDCALPSVETQNIELGFELVGQHLMADEGNRLQDDGAEGGGNDTEDHGGFWNWSDALATAACSEGSPFTGKGLETNYDDPYFAASPPPGFPYPGQLTSDDEYCSGVVCDDLKFRTSIDPVFSEFRELDRGDFIPYHWNISSHQEVLRRLNPNHGSSTPDYGVAGYFSDTPTATGYLALKDASKRPIVAAGETAFGKAINDYRCWYLGPNIGPAGKCREGTSTIPFEDGWQQIAEDRDPDYACRRPYAILITDGEDTCEGESPTADVNDFDSYGVKTWIINLGGREGEKRLNSIVKTSKAPITTIGTDNPNDLRDELNRIIGIIESESRAFAAAAVPSVQTEDEQKIFLTAFNALNAAPVWAGQALAFLKPLPLKDQVDEEGVTQKVPDTSRVCTATDTENCFLWDAGEVLKTQVKPAEPFGPAADQRRVVYPRTAVPGGVPQAREAFDLSTASSFGTAIEKDFWRGLGVPFTEGVESSEIDARAAANDIVDYTYSLKSAQLDPADPTSVIEYVLGDNFHAEPVVVAAPTSNLLFVQNFEGYRDFALKHRFRRKMLFVPTNDGMLHIFDAGVPRKVTDGSQVRVEYDRGSGRELAAFIPRSVLPAIKFMADGGERPWTVDGGMTVADVFLDPTHAGTPDPDNREWRTVLVAGLRRGGETVYALDITQPDDLAEVTVTEPVEETVLVPDLAAADTLANCWNTTGDGDQGCDEDVLWPQPLWAFADTVIVGGNRVRLDEDGNNEPDFAQSWSQPNVGRIQLEENGSVVDKFVAIFGGGLDPEKPGLRGNFLYMVDLETGKTIYKKRLLDALGGPGGSAPSEPAAVDTNQDGLLDRVYIGTTGGYLYRVDLGPDVDGNLPALEDYALTVMVGGVPEPVAGQKRFNRAPRIVFDNLNSTTGRRLPFYFRPSVIFTPLLSPNYALALGDGDRENLWSPTDTPGRFYLFVDDTDQAGGPITAADLERITPGGATTIADFLFEPNAGNRNGWYIELNAGERVTADAFALSGIVVFSTFQPEVQDFQDPDNRRLRLCSRRGDSRAFAVLATNANGVLFDSDSNRVRSTAINTLVSKAFADLAAPPVPPGGDGTPPPEPDPLPPNMQLVLDELKKLFPSNCRFASYRIDIRAVAADTEVVDIAPVPVCVIEKNWREF
jgi:hypothetical protein